MKWTNCSKELVTDIAYNGVDTFLAVGQGKVFYSNDGKNWTLYASNIFGDSTGGNRTIITYNSVDTWVVGCNNTTGNNLAYSNDGKIWTPVTNIFGGGDFVDYIVYNGVDTWVAIGGSSIGYSKDGKKWTPVTNPISGFGIPLAYNGVDTWIALGDSVAAHSKDGETWLAVEAPYIIKGTDLAYNGVDTWVAVGIGNDELSCIIYSKNNGASWVKGIINCSRPNGGSFASVVTSVAYNGIDTWVAIGGGYKIPTTLYSKDDGVTWKKGTDIFSGGSGTSVAYNGVDTWVAVGYDSGKKFIAVYSTDGINWTIGTGTGIDIGDLELFVKFFTLK